MHNGKAYAILMGDEIILYTRRRTLVFNSYQEVISWLKNK